MSVRELEGFAAVEFTYGSPPTAYLTWPIDNENDVKVYKRTFKDKVPGDLSELPRRDYVVKKNDQIVGGIYATVTYTDNSRSESESDTYRLYAVRDTARDQRSDFTRVSIGSNSYSDMLNKALDKLTLQTQELANLSLKLSVDDMERYMKDDSKRRGYREDLRSNKINATLPPLTGAKGKALIVNEYENGFEFGEAGGGGDSYWEISNQGVLQNIENSNAFAGTFSYESNDPKSGALSVSNVGAHALQGRSGAEILTRRIENSKETVRSLRFDPETEDIEIYVNKDTYSSSLIVDVNGTTIIRTGQAGVKSIQLFDKFADIDRKILGLELNIIDFESRVQTIIEGIKEIVSEDVSALEARVNEIQKDVNKNKLDIQDTQSRCTWLEEKMVEVSGDVDWCKEEINELWKAIFASKTETSKSPA